MIRNDLMKRHLSDALYTLCETQVLPDITVTEVAAAAEVSRQTFYNHFADIDDLICYAASLPLFSEKSGFTDLENSRKAYEISLDHKPFFMQLALHSGQNSYRRRYIEFFEQLYGEHFLTDELEPKERAFRELAIKAYLSASIDLYFAWAATGMEAPVDCVVCALQECTPSFIATLRDGSVPVPDHYPR